MKLHYERKSTVFELERQPMPEGRFRALCSLMLAAIIGGVLVGIVALVGFWAVPWLVGALLGVLVAIGFYRSMTD